MHPARAAAAVLLALTAGSCATARRTSPPQPHWVTAAAQAMSTVRSVPTTDETCRQPIRSTYAGDRVRVRLSNVMSSTPLHLEHITVGLHTTGAGLEAPQPATVAGRTTITIPAHGYVTTDPLPVPVTSGGDVVVSFAVVGTASLSEHLVGAATGWCTGAGRGDHTQDASSKAFARSHPEGLVVESIEVQTTATTHGIVAVGDSLTDPPLPPDTYQRWTDVVAARTDRPVANVAIGGNRVVLPGGYGHTLAQRFERDVLHRPGADTVVLFAGTNDVAVGIAPSTLIAQLTELCGKAHRARLRVVVVTLVPAWRRPAATERTRQMVNDWLRTTKAADVHVDADALLRDPARPSHLLPAYDLGDGLHLSVAGHAALGTAIADALLT